MMNMQSPAKLHFLHQLSPQWAYQKAPCQRKTNNAIPKKHFLLKIKWNVIHKYNPSIQSTVLRKCTRSRQYATCTASHQVPIITHSDTSLPVAVRSDPDQFCHLTFTKLANLGDLKVSFFPLFSRKIHVVLVY